MPLPRTSLCGPPEKAPLTEPPSLHLLDCGNISGGQRYLNAPAVRHGYFVQREFPAPQKFTFLTAGNEGQRFLQVASNLRSAMALITRGDDVMEDRVFFDAINELTREEHEIWAKESHGQATDAERDRLRRIGGTLDQCWDLLHQRRARRAAGLNPDDAKVRDEKTVEGYIG